MKVFLAGATGAIGTPLVKRLLDGGHHVVGTTRSPERARKLAETGVEAVIGDCLDRSEVMRLVGNARPETVIHQATAIPKKLDPRRAGRQLDPTHRLRTEGTRHLIAAAVAAGAERFVAQSVAFAYRPGPGELRIESDPLFIDAAEPMASIAGAVASLEAAVLGEKRLTGIVLRYGFLYGPGTAYSKDGSATAEVRRRGIPIMGGGQGVFSFVHVEDAAQATVLAMEQGAAGVYNVVDDDPAPAADWVPLFAEANGAAKPLKIPRWLGRLVGGPYATYLMTEMPGASNSKIRSTLPWEPRYASWRQGFLQTGDPPTSRTAPI